MEIVKDLVNNQLALYLPVVLVMIVVTLVYTFGMKSAEQPPFNKLTNDDRRQSIKKKKIKEKKTTVNGYVSTGDIKNEKALTRESKRSPAKELSEPQKQKEKKVENKVAEKNKKNEAIKNKVIEEVKTKKSVKKLLNDEPADVDDGNWETVQSKSDKKKKPEQSPVKKEKKTKKTEKAVEIEKFVKEVVNKELREQEKEVTIEKPVTDLIEVEEAVVVIEEKKEKVKEKKVKKESEKPAEQPVKKEVAKTKVAKAPPQEESSEESPKASSKGGGGGGGVAFDELGDIWTEAKAAKKSKKKARRDN